MLLANPISVRIKTYFKIVISQNSKQCFANYIRTKLQTYSAPTYDIPHRPRRIDPMYQSLSLELNFHAIY